LSIRDQTPMTDLNDRNRGAAVWLGGMVACMATAQVVFKFAGIHAASEPDIPQAILANPWLWGGLACAAAGTLCWLLALRTLSLARAYPWTATIYVLTPLASALLFGDVLDGKFLLGMTLIAGGVILTTGGVEAP
jgi:drug/metabolite transporter (DMT)-like permease